MMEIRRGGNMVMSDSKTGFWDVILRIRDW